MNRKGDALISDFFGYIFLVILVILFFMLAVGIKEEPTVRTTNAVEVENLKTDLLLFMRQPIGSYGRVYEAGELIVEAEFRPERDEIMENIRSSVENKFNHLREGFSYDGWALQIEYSDGSRYTFGSAAANSLKGNLVSTSVNLPGYNGGSILVTLEKWKVTLRAGGVR